MIRARVSVARAVSGDWVGPQTVAWQRRFFPFTRRVTKDVRTGDVIDDEYKLIKHNKKFLFRELPGAPRDISTVFYYIAPTEGVDSDASSQYGADVT